MRIRRHAGAFTSTHLGGQHDGQATHDAQVQVTEIKHRRLVVVVNEVGLHQEGRGPHRTSRAVGSRSVDPAEVADRRC